MPTKKTTTKAKTTRKKVDPKITEMNKYARRIWDGQSIDLPLAERVSRVKNGLEGQGFTQEDIGKLSLPTKEARKVDTGAL